MSKKILCYFHKIDLDGKCSAAIVKRKYPDCELIGVDYPDRPDFKKILEDKIECVIIVDFSFEPADMQALMDYTDGNVLWIDHHKSAIEKVSKVTLPESTTTLNQVISGKREIGKAGCELTWEYFFTDEAMPEAVRLLGRYDVWDKSDEYDWIQRILPFQMGMRLTEAYPEKLNYWDSIFKNYFQSFDNILEEGKTILIYENQRNTTYARSMAFKVEFEGHKAWAINKALSSSTIFEIIENAKDRPLWILFSFNGKAWKYTLYSAPNSGIDVSKIAVKYGGGEHAGAAGFQTDSLIFNSNK